MNLGRVAGILMIVGGIVIFGFGALFSLGQRAAGELNVGGAIVGLGLASIPALFLAGIGIVLLTRSRQEQEEGEERAELRKILDVVLSRGEVQISDLVLELGTSRKEVQDQIYALVGMGLYSGYINWDEGTLYSAEASSIRDLRRCKFCGGEVEFAGKGVLHCPYCGAEYFIS
ncbi:MAG: hypothetical protein BMS9Abin28_0623 [Anaerolineae bacterium]|nr:MAG: hypothetical protein BMS9Abin28_0623 [Anaerolineae bacterium]